ncbi:hypothetical protein EXIGLDRAFT_470726 [Exidia glandulosa HHB12029]|uniref:Uncharacterized protein n=1 Tax=Exidia glandulosa HHB12029 TaxID=1314781 RepID=A0A165JZM3_EXIGL|nr:hypothetical protein EXIGLDRAFT_470726 [Exidia glandulosa HHB12029]
MSVKVQTVFLGVSRYQQHVASAHHHLISSCSGYFGNCSMPAHSRALKPIIPVHLSLLLPLDCGIAVLNLNLALMVGIRNQRRTRNVHAVIPRDLRPARPDLIFLHAEGIRRCSCAPTQGTRAGAEGS